MPHLLPIDQGLMASCYVRPNRDVTADEVRALFEDAYRDEPFVELVDAPPGVRDVRDTNLCRIHATGGERDGDGVRRDRQPLEGRRGPGGAGPQPDARATTRRRASL